MRSAFLFSLPELGKRSVLDLLRLTLQVLLTIVWLWWSIRHMTVSRLPFLLGSEIHCWMPLWRLSNRRSFFLLVRAKWGLMRLFMLAAFFFFFEVVLDWVIEENSSLIANSAAFFSAFAADMSILLIGLLPEALDVLQNPHETLSVSLFHKQDHVLFTD